LQQCGSDIGRISADILDTVKHYQRDPDVRGVPVMKYHDQLLGCQRKVEECFSHVKYFMAQQQRVLDDFQHRNPNGKGADYDERDQWMVEKDHSYSGGPDSKKMRRGRAAPPGRCHSCNRAETPEWRRGPDGARTLCNACGLHYAKLTRKTGAKAAAPAGSSLWPKEIEESRPSAQ
jgi:predicted Fe-S protein YdhL (DUF1289 family)